MFETVNNYIVAFSLITIALIPLLYDIKVINDKKEKVYTLMGKTFMVLIGVAIITTGIKVHFDNISSSSLKNSITTLQNKVEVDSLQYVINTKALGNDVDERALQIVRNLLQVRDSITTKQTIAEKKELEQHKITQNKIDSSHKLASISFPLEDHNGFIVKIIDDSIFANGFVANLGDEKAFCVHVVSYLIIQTDSKYIASNPIYSIYSQDMEGQSKLSVGIKTILTNNLIKRAKLIYVFEQGYYYLDYDKKIKRPVNLGFTYDPKTNEYSLYDSDIPIDEFIKSAKSRKI